MERRRVGILPVVERTAVKTRQVPLRTAQKQAVAQVLGVAHADPDALLLANERQLAAAKAAQAALADALAAVESGYTLDAAGVCVDDALNALYALTGESATEDVIEEVFAKFCVGK